MKYDSRLIKNLISIFGITIIFAALFSLVQILYDPLFFTPEFISEGLKTFEVIQVRRNSIFGYLSRNEIGFSFIAILAVFISVKKLGDVSLKNLLPYILLGAIVTISTNSRWVMLNFTIVLLIFIIQSRAKLKKSVQYSFLFFFIIIFLINLLPYLRYDLNLFIEKRLLAESSLSRITAIYYFSQFFPAHPFWGRGFHLTSEYVFLGGSSQIHVGFLSHLDDWGLIGSFFLFSAWGLMLKDFYRTAKTSNFYGSYIAFITYLVSNLTLVHYGFYKYGLLLAFVFNKYYQYLNKNKKRIGHTAMKKKKQKVLSL